MSAKRTDISTIKKYLAGELDARAMHRLEREAQDDPFLMEAIEGYAGKKTDQQGQLDVLHHRLQQRIHQKKVLRLPSRGLMAAAASILIVLTLSYLLWPSHRKSNSSTQMAAVVPKMVSPQVQPDTSKKPVKQERLTATPPPAEVDRSVSQQVKQATPPSASTMLAVNAVPTANTTALRQTDTTARYTAVAKPKQTDSTIALLATKKENLLSNNTPAPAMARARTMAVMMVPHTRVNGIVSDETGHMLSDVNVAEKGKPEIVKTDNKGRFSIPANDGDVLVFTSPGFKNTEEKGTVSDSLNVIMSSESKSMSEMVAIDFGRSAAAPIIKEAHPQVSWDNYNQYLKNYAFITKGKAGTVRLSFTIDAGGRLNDFKILKSLSAEADQIAVHLIKDGPAWVPDVSGKTKTVTLKIAFTLRQP